jgi:hypothetical protein
MATVKLRVVDGAAIGDHRACPKCAGTETKRDADDVCRRISRRQRCWATSFTVDTDNEIQCASCEKVALVRTNRHECGNCTKGLDTGECRCSTVFDIICLRCRVKCYKTYPAFDATLSELVDFLRRAKGPSNLSSSPLNDYDDILESLLGDTDN